MSRHNPGARRIALSARADATLRAWRLYLAGSAMAFERGWLSLHQVLAARAGAQSVYLFTRNHMYEGRPCSTSSNPRPPAT